MVSKVGIKGLKLRCKIGVDSGEELFERVIFVDVEAKLKEDYRGGLDTTISYSEMAGIIRKKIEGKEFKLIEDVAMAVADAVTSFKNIGSVYVKVTKLSVPSDADYAYFIYSANKKS
ncbi:MAG: dihydroneopterin aldolase [Nitrososphaeria archaeon]|nr:dihydroneopterin aldolase [Conexivisphaerales archaeon]